MAHLQAELLGDAPMSAQQSPLRPQGEERPTASDVESDLGASSGGHRSFSDAALRLADRVLGIESAPAPPTRGDTPASGADHEPVTPVSPGAVLYVADRRFEVPAEGCTIGRDPGCAHLVVNHEEVSRRHAHIAADAGELSVRDLGSTNGTVVQRGRRQHAVTGVPLQLMPGDRLLTRAGVLLAEVLDAGGEG